MIQRDSENRENVFSSSLQDNWILKEVNILSNLYDSVETVAE